MDYEIETKFTVVKQARQVKPESHTFLNLRHNSEHVDHVISGIGRPQENRIFRFLKFIKIAFYPKSKNVFTGVHCMKYRIRWENKN